MKTSVGNVSSCIVSVIDQFCGATANEICSFILKHHNIRKEIVRDHLRYLESSGEISAIRIRLGGAVRKIYCSQNNKVLTEKLIEKVGFEILSVLGQKLVLVTPELIDYSREKIKDASISLIRMVLKLLGYRNEIWRLPFLTSKNRMAYFYFLNAKRHLIDGNLKNIMHYFERNKYGSATLISRGLGIELKEAALFIRHLAYLGELNATVVGYIPDYQRRFYIFYVPGCKEIVKKRHEIERKREYIEHSKILFEFLVEQIGLKVREEVIKDSLKYLRLCIERGIQRGRDLDRLIVGAFVVALRRHNVPVSVAEVVKNLKLFDISDVSEGNVLSAEKLIARSLEIPLSHFLEKSEYERYIERFVDRLRLLDSEKQSLIKQSFNLLSSIPKEFLLGKKPSTIAAATIYAAALSICESIKREYPLVTQTEVSMVSGVTEVSIRNWYRSIKGFYNASKN